MVLCGRSLWLIITIILNLIGRLTEQSRSEEADMFSLDLHWDSKLFMVCVCVCVCEHQEFTCISLCFSVTEASQPTEY